MTKKRLIKATIILLIIVKFLHYNSFVFEQYHLNQSVVEVSAQVTRDSSMTGESRRNMPLTSVINLSAMVNLKNKDNPLISGSRQLTLVFDLNGVEHNIKKAFFKNQHYIEHDLPNKIAQIGSYKFFVNPQYPEKDIFIFKPRPSDSEITRFFISVSTLIFALLCFVPAKRIRHFSQILCAFSLGALMALTPFGVLFIPCAILLAIYVSIALGISKLFKKLRPSEKPPA